MKLTESQKDYDMMRSHIHDPNATLPGIRYIPLSSEFILKWFDHLNVDKLYLFPELVCFSCTDALDPSNDFDTALRPSQALEEIIANAQKQLNLTKHGYVAVHQRGMDGECLQRTGNTYSLIPEMRAHMACNITADVVANIRIQTSVREEIPLFLADDK